MKSLFLQGYGSSIKVKDTCLVFTQGIHHFSKDREIIKTSVRACSFDKVIIQGEGFLYTKVFYPFVPLFLRFRKMFSCLFFRKMFSCLFFRKMFLPLFDRFSDLFRSFF